MCKKLDIIIIIITNSLSFHDLFHPSKKLLFNGILIDLKIGKEKERKNGM